MFDIANFLSVKIALAALKLMYLDTYKIFSNALPYERSVKGNNQDSERRGTITLAVLKLSSSYTGPYLIAEFS